ncbi:MAG: hypothetical protein B7Z62_04545 [Deltaproteobacteria bacterium 37-65-8]|nr:MAG: hypothetical protein B7Z62_04545 [Deltaproteobacteria bacterium 37-65-8]
MEMKHLRLVMAVLMMAILAAVPVMAEEQKADSAPAAAPAEEAAPAATESAPAAAPAEAPQTEAPAAVPAEAPASAK